MRRNRRIGLTILAVLGLLIGAMGWYTARIWHQAALDQELIQAARRGDIARLQRALQRGANPNAQESDTPLSLWERVVQALRGRSTLQATPALIVAMQKRPYLAVLLLQHGADPDCRDLQGTPALMKAIAGYDMRLVGALLDHGVKINAANVDGDTALMWAAGERLSWGGDRYDMGLVNTLLEHGADANAHNLKGQTPLIWAIGRVNIGSHPFLHSEAMVEPLVAHGADVNAIGRSGNSVLAWSAQLEPGLLPWLIAHGAKVNTRMASGNFGFTLRQDKGVDSQSVGFGPTNNATLLMMFAQRGDRNTVRLLLAHGADVNATNDQGQTALQLARDPRVRALLQQAAAKH